jgi:farnesyl diphosphate synthase
LTELPWSDRTTFPEALADAARLTDIVLDRLLVVPEDLEARVYRAMRYSALAPGKRMRPFLVLAGARLFGVAGSCALQAAAAVEMVHAYSLVHDDLPAMDDDDLRRGQPSTHKAFDEATAILAGDALQARAFEVLAEPDTHSDPHARCELVAALGALESANADPGLEGLEMAVHARDEQLAAMDAVRAAADKLETVVANDLWPLPKYEEMLFIK